jgi:hypothetical protein
MVEQRQLKNKVPTQTSSDLEVEATTFAERKLRLKVDLRLCTIAGFALQSQSA